MAVGRWRRESVDGIDGRCRCCGVARVTRPRVVLVLLATEPNELRTIYVSGTIQCLRVAGYNCRWWAAVALGGPVSINQPALNTRARARARPCGIALLAPTDRNCPECGSRAQSMSRGGLPGAFEARALLAERQNNVF